MDNNIVNIIEREHFDTVHIDETITERVIVYSKYKYMFHFFNTTKNNFYKGKIVDLYYNNDDNNRQLSGVRVVYMNFDRDNYDVIINFPSPSIQKNNPWLITIETDNEEDDQKTNNNVNNYEEHKNINDHRRDYYFDDDEDEDEDNNINDQNNKRNDNNNHYYYEDDQENRHYYLEDNFFQLGQQLLDFDDEDILDEEPQVLQGVQHHQGLQLRYQEVVPEPEWFLT